MLTLKFIHLQDGEMFLGYLGEYPDYWTQGDSREELKENLADLTDTFKAAASRASADETSW